MIKLKKGDSVFLSEVGNNGFFYPTKDVETLIEDVDAHSPAWVGCSGMKPVLIPRKSIRALDKTSKLVPVWVSKNKGWV